jgi:Flp pilus assembly pilin Flp
LDHRGQRARVGAAVFGDAAAVRAFRITRMCFPLLPRKQKKECVMKCLVTLGKRFFVEENAAEVTELGIVLALIVALSIGVIKLIGTAVSTNYQTVDTAITGS